MRLPLFVTFAFGSTSLWAQTVLTLVDEPDFNQIDVNLDVEFIGPSSDTAELSGFLTADLDFDPLTGQVSTFSLLNADITSTDVSLQAGNFFANYNLQIDSLAFDALTPAPPATVDPTSGDFANNQHQFTACQGLVSGNGDTLFSDPFAVDLDFSEQPFSNQGSGTGNVSVAFNRRENRTLIFDVIARIPLALNQEIDDPSLPVGVTVNIDGTVKASGQTTLTLPDYQTWASANQLPPASESAFQLSPNAPNFLAFALGFAAGNTPAQLISISPTHATLHAASPYALGDFFLEGSADLINWSPIPGGTFTLGTPLDHALQVPLAQLPAFLRLRAQWPTP